MTCESNNYIDTIYKMRKKLQINLMLCLFFNFVIIKIGGMPTIHNFDIWSDNNDNNKLSTFLNNNLTVNLTHHRDSKVLNFFPVPVEEECLSDDKRRRGICMNTYECRIQGGTSHGPCALGFGVCCVFAATCEQEAVNNLTYFVNPNFPDYTYNTTVCGLKIKKIDPEITQLRLDFVHFHLGQPNRKTGMCEEDIFLISGNRSKSFTLCGTNSDQHVYIDIDNNDEIININMNLTKKVRSRMWEVVITQVPFTQRAPAGCFQFYTGKNGIIRTLNFAENGRHLANQDYNICIRQEHGMCSIAYEPCDENSFRIGPNNDNISSGSEIIMTDDSNNVMGIQDEFADIGSGDDAQPRLDICGDRITLPCDSDEFLMDGDIGIGYCNLVHCGNSLCPFGENPCRIESTVTPFTIGIHFGMTTDGNNSPEDNIGMCLKYEQQNCVESVAQIIRLEQIVSLLIAIISVILILQLSCH